MTCASCDYWRPDEGEQVTLVSRGASGECRRHAPIAKRLSYEWPTTSALEWCGDYQRHCQRRINIHEDTSC